MSIIYTAEIHHYDEDMETDECPQIIKDISGVSEGVNKMIRLKSTDGTIYLFRDIISLKLTPQES